MGTASRDSGTVGSQAFQRWARRLRIGAWVVGIPLSVAGLWQVVRIVQIVAAGEAAQSGLPERVLGAFVFLTLGIGGPWMVHSLLDRGWAYYQRVRFHPEAPWLWNAAWADGRIPHSRGARAARAWAGGAILSGALIGGAVLLAPVAAPHGIPPRALYTVVAAVALWLLVQAVLETVRWRKFGVSYCHLVENPGVVGGWLRVRLELPQGLRPGDAVQFRLKHLYRRSKRGGSGRGGPKTLWQLEHTVPFEAMEVEGGSTTHVRVDLYIPREAGVGQAAFRKGDYWWRLEARARLLGLDYSASFDVPVFVTRDSRDETPQEAIDQFGAAVDASMHFQSPPHVSVVPVGDGLVIHGEPAPGLGKHLLFLAILAAVVAGSAALFGGAGTDWIRVALGFVLTSPIVLILLLMLYARSEVHVTREGATRRWRFLCFERTQQAHVADGHEVALQAYSGRGGNEAYRVYIKCTADAQDTLLGQLRNPTVATRIEHRKQAEWLKNLISSLWHAGEPVARGTPKSSGRP